MFDVLEILYIHVMRRREEGGGRRKEGGGRRKEGRGRRKEQGGRREGGYYFNLFIFFANVKNGEDSNALI